MTSTSSTTRKHSRLEPDTQDNGCVPNIQTVQDNTNAITVFPGQEQRNDEPPQSTDVEVYHVPSSSDENQEVVVTAIRGRDVALGLRRLPAGFYVVLHHNGLEWRTENKRSLVNSDIVEWSGLIPMPSDLSAVIRLGVYASFEFRPVLGAGEQLQSLTTTVGQLLDRSLKDALFTFSPEDGDVVSPCSSILVTVEWRKREHSDPSGSSVVGSHWSPAEPRGEIEDATDQGHRALSRYRKYERKPDLECSIERFERALNVCPLDHPCRAAAQSNLAMANLILSQVEGTDDPSEVALLLHQAALAARPTGHPDRPLSLIHLASVHFARLQRRGDRVDEANGENAERLLYEAIEISTAESYEKRAATLMLLTCAGHGRGPIQSDGESSVNQDLTANVTEEDPWVLNARLLERFQQFGDLADLQQAITILEGLIQSTAAWGHGYCLALGNLGTALLYRFERLGQLSDLEDAISAHQDAVNLTPDGHPDKSMHLGNLGSSFQTRFNRLRQLNDVEDAISTHRVAVDLTPDTHPDKSMRLSNLGIAFRTRFECLGQLSDLEAAISVQRDAINPALDGHPNKPVCLSNLGTSFHIRFERLGQLSDIEDAILTLKDAVDLTPDGHPEKPVRLSNLGTSFQARFKCLGQLSDIEDSILMLRDAVDLTPDGHSDKPMCLHNLGTSLQIRFEHLGELSDLENAILRKKDAVDLTPDGHPDKRVRLGNLGISLKTRFECLGQLGDLEDAISAHKDAVDLTPVGHPDMAMYLNNLGGSFQTRFKRLGRLSDLEDAISTHWDAVNLTPNGHPNKPLYLTNLGSSFRTRFQHFGQLSDLENAVLIQRDTINLIPDGQPSKPMHLNNLGISLRARFQRLGQFSDLEDAISTHRNAVDLIPNGHPDKPIHLSNLGNSFQTRFERLGQLSDIEEAISAYKDAVNRTPDGHHNKPMRLSNLGISYETRFARLGQLSDLENAISTLREAVDLTPDNQPDKPMCLNNLGISFRTRFECLRQPSDVEDAISSHRDAVELIPDGHPDKPLHLNNLGISFRTRFEHLVKPNDIEDAISMLRFAVDLTPDGHPDKPMYLNNLGSSFQTRFEHLGKLNDIEDAISALRGAIDLTPDDHPERPMYLNNLGTFFDIRFKRLGRFADLEHAISTLRDAVGLTPHDHPHRPGRLNNLARSFAARFLRLGQVTDLEHVLSLSSYVASTPIGSTGVRLSAAKHWILCARLIRHPSLLHAYSVAVTLLPRLAWIGLPLSHRFDELTQGVDVVGEAVAAALDAGFRETALEWLEQGRSIVWEDLFQLRSSYEELSSAHPDYASRLHALSTQLDQASAAHEHSLSTRSEQGPEVHHRAKSLQQVADRHRAMAIERDQLLQEIRRLPGFERFLLRKPFTQLRPAAHSGPVVMLNVAKNRCDALIVLAGVDHVIHVPLPTLTLKRSVDLQNTLNGFVRDARVGGTGAQIGISWKTVLSPLWKSIVKPVLDALAIQSTPVDPSRIFWCPTGPLAFLPIHAAGFYDEQCSEPGHKIFDFVVSSYVPTLSTLLRSPIPNTAPPSSPLRILLVPQPPSDGKSKLPGVAVELQHINHAVSDSSSACTTLESSDGTVEEVLELMRQADWVHFACHGVQDGVDSGLCLADGRRLKLRDIVALSRPRGGLAFLSACHTAKGEQRLSDEAIHIAAGMLFAGYGGVVGTMWTISDVIAPDVARIVYEELLGKGPRVDYREAARALHKATRDLRRRDVSFDKWIPFIHVGL